jgi:hypothetical protein
MFSEGLEVGESSEGIRPFEGVEGRRSDEGPQEDKFRRERDTLLILH